jgi:hypothetical protein
MLLYVLTLITAAAAALTQPMQRHRLPAPQPLRVRLRLFPSMRTAAPAMSAPTDGDALQVPSDPSTSHATLGPLVTATARLVRESTGKGGESSGSGRPEWGTWADTDLFDAVRDELNSLRLVASEDGVWPRLWEVAGGEKPSATLRVAGGIDYDVLLRLFASPVDTSDSERSCTVKYYDGVLSLIKPLLGLVKVAKLRPSGEVIGVA